MPADFVDEQLEAVFAGATVDAVKTGMLASADIVRVVAVALREQHVATLVVDPVIMSTSGARLLSEDALEMLRDELLPLARVVLHRTSPKLPSWPALRSVMWPA